MTMMSVVGLGSALVIHNVLPKKGGNRIGSSGDNVDDVTREETTTNQQQPSTGDALPQPSQSATDSDTLTQSAPTATPQKIQSPALVCFETCRRGNHCAYPGKCHEYKDANSNGLCDLGECS
jgi:hypothetical protein